MVARKQTVQEVKLDMFQSNVNAIHYRLIISLNGTFCQIASKLYILMVT